MNTDRLPPLAAEEWDEAQHAAAQELIAGPRKGVKGPFIPLLRSPKAAAAGAAAGRVPALFQRAALASQ